MKFEKEGLMTRSEIARIGRDIISEMFRWGNISTESIFADIDLRAIDDNTVIHTLKKMIDMAYISSDTENNSAYYVNELLIEEIENA